MILRGRASFVPGRAAFSFIFVTVALDMLGVGIMAPVLPKLIVSLEHGNLTRAALLTGLFGFAWAAMQFLFSPVLGAVSDRFGRRPVVLLSNLGLGLDYVVLALAPTVGWLFLGRVISGITAASFSTASAYIADISPPEQRARRFGMLGAAFGLGFIVGPALGGVLGSIDLRLPFWVAAVVALGNSLYGYFVLPESLPPERRARISWSGFSPIGSLGLFLGHRALLGLAGAAILYSLAHEALPSMFVLYTDYRYNFSERDVGLALAAVGVCTAVVSGGLVGPVVARIGEKRALLVGLGSGVVGLGIFAAAGSGWVFVAGMPFVALWGLAGPSLQSLMSAQIQPAEQGRLQGAMSSLRGVTGMAGPILFAQAFAFGIAPRGGWLLPGAPYWIAAGLLVMSGLVAWSAVTRRGRLSRQPSEVEAV